MAHLEPLQGALEAYCRRNLNDPNAIEDVLQTAVGHAFRDFHLYVEGTNFRAWMFRYLNLEIFSRNRQDARNRGQPLAGDPAAEEAWETAVSESLFDALPENIDLILEQCDEMLADAVRELPQTERSVFLLRSVGEFKYREIAEILEIPVGTVMSHLSRSRVRLRRRLIDYARQHGFL